MVITRQYGTRGREWRLNVALVIITSKIRVLATRLSLYIMLAPLNRSAKGYSLTLYQSHRHRIMDSLSERQIHFAALIYPMTTESKNPVKIKCLSKSGSSAQRPLAPIKPAPFDPRMSYRYCPFTAPGGLRGLALLLRTTTPPLQHVKLSKNTEL
jgi:hypothetical protein